MIDMKSYPCSYRKKHQDIYVSLIDHYHDSVLTLNCWVILNNRKRYFIQISTTQLIRLYFVFLMDHPYLLFPPFTNIIFLAICKFTHFDPYLDYF
jgi:hypothetical protein